jgi:sugar/nucleoside kinase (ribokinase family)
MEPRPDYLVIGHVSKDLLPGGEGARAGGTVTYAAITAQRLGLQAAIVTSIAPADEALLRQAQEEGVWIRAIPSDETTTFRNVYDRDGRRTQILSGRASDIEWSDIPVGWRGAGIVHLGPVAQELAADLPSHFPYGLLGVTPQGWLRSWDDEGLVRQSAWPVPKALEALPPNAFLILSMEDLGYHLEHVDSYVKLTPLVAITQGSGEALLYGGKGRRKLAVPAFDAHISDLTGAGDVFAAALLVRYHETADPEESARFAHAAAACSIEGPGTQAIPTRQRVMERR